MTGNDLKPISPNGAQSKYLENRKEDASYETYRTIRKAVNLFVEWTTDVEVSDMNEIRGRELDQFRTWLRNESDNSTISLNGILHSVRRFLVYCVTIEAVGTDVPDKVPIPEVAEEAEISDDKPSSDQVNAVLEYLERSEPRSRRRVEYEMTDEIGFRVGALRGIDRQDIDLENKVIKLRHRPSEEFGVKGTPLKNGLDGERNVNISDDLAEVIAGYLANPDRNETVDKFGREPLLTTKDGRPTVDTIRRDLYKVSRPCVYSGECPHGRELDSCDAYKNSHASACPTSHSPHPLRRYSIEKQIEQGISKELLCDRVDVSVPVLNKHYDRREKERKRRHRLKVMAALVPGYDAPDDIPSREDGSASISNSDDLLDANSMKSVKNSTETEESDSESEQATLHNFSDGFTSVFGPASIPAVLGIHLSRWLHRQLRELRAESTANPLVQQ